MDFPLYILLPVHNRLSITKQYVENLKLQTYRNYKLILIDDGSTDGTGEVIKEILPDSVILRGKGSWYWGGSLQQGYLWLKNNHIGDNSLVLISNDDTLYDKYFLETGVKLVTCATKTLYGAQEYDQSTNQLINSGFVANFKNYGFTKANPTDQISCLSTRGLFLKYVDFMEIGGFYPRLLPHYGSDYEFTMRSYKKGFSLKTNSALFLWVDNRTTGIRQINHQNVKKYLNSVLTKRSTNNPIYKSIFLIIGFKNYKLPYNVLLVWYSFFKHLIISTLNTFR